MTAYRPQSGTRFLAIAAVCLSVAAGGCRAIDLYTPTLQAPVPPALEPPRELSKVSLPTYRLQPPDVLYIDIIKLVPRPPYRIEAYDVLQLCVSGTLPDDPINGDYLVEDDGSVTLGPAYGRVRVAGMSIEEATRAITSYLARLLRQPVATVQLIRSAGAQQVASQYLVQSDGVVNLGRYGMVHVAGMTITEARQAVDQRLAQYFDSPEVTVDVIGYNSLGYYVVVAGAGMGENVQRFAITGNDTVLDAISRLEGLPGISSKVMWVARAAPKEFGAEQVLPVDWAAIARGGVTDTNYQLLPGDRLFVVDDSLVAANNILGRFTNPLERVLNVTNLGGTTVLDSQTLGRAYNQAR